MARGWKREGATMQENNDELKKEMGIFYRLLFSLFAMIAMLFLGHNSIMNDVVANNTKKVKAFDEGKVFSCGKKKTYIVSKQREWLVDRDTFVKGHLSEEIRYCKEVEDETMDN